MKNRLLFTLVALIMCVAAFGQNNFVLSKDGIGPVKMGMDYTKAKPAMSDVCKMIWEMYHDMIDMMQVTCFDNENDQNMMVQFNTGEAPDDKLLRTFYVFSPIFKTSKGLSVESTAKDLQDAGGKLTRSEYHIYVALDGLYYFFNEDDLSGKELKPDAKPFQIANVPRGVEF